jgi:ABC-type multidrug transport system ATPase subunit
MTGAPGALLAAHRVTCRFGSFVAVDDVTVHVDRGEVVGLLGANGAGKTTLLRLLLGLLPPTSGSVAMLGGPPSRERRSRLGYVPQGLGLYGDLTVRENLVFTAQAYGAPVPSLPDPLGRYADTLVHRLPLGLQRRLSLVAALSHTPEVLVLDEPTSGVDALGAAGAWETIRTQAEAGVAVLVTTHSMGEATQCDRLLLMAAGRVAAQGSEADIIGDTRAYSVRTDDWAAAFAALDAAGEPVMLAGRDVRVADSDPARLEVLLQRAGLGAQVVEVPATLEERMKVLSLTSTAAQER